MAIFDLVVLAMLLAGSVILSRQRPRDWLIDRGRALLDRLGHPEHTPEWEREHAELWLMARRRQLTEDLERIERLLRHDQTRSATRQLGNRLAREQLLASLARIPDPLPGQDRSLARPTRYSIAGTDAHPEEIGYGRARPTPAFGVRVPSIEVLDVGGWRGLSTPPSPVGRP